MLESGVLEDIDEVNSIMSAELPQPGEDDELRGLVLQSNMHRRSPYCLRNSHCRFGYLDHVITPETHIDEARNRIVYRRREEEDFKVVP